MSEYILEMKGVCKSFPGVKALDHVQLALRPASVLALMGENGAGKSTLMKCWIFSKTTVPMELSRSPFLQRLFMRWLLPMQSLPAP